MQTKKIKTALISVYHKEGLDTLLETLTNFNIELYSTGGTAQFIKSCGYAVTPIEDITTYPSILGGRVKSLHPKIFGGILYKRDDPDDRAAVEKYKIPNIDLLITDLYPFEEAVANQSSESDIIEKIDVGGVSLIRAAAKNHQDVFVIASRNDYGNLITILEEQAGTTSLYQRKTYAARAFAISSCYDAAIFKYLDKPDTSTYFIASSTPAMPLRYGENPHQKGWYYGNLSKFVQQIQGKTLSYNNLLDIEASVQLINEFQGVAFAILKHNNPCGLSLGKTVKEAFEKAFQADTISAFGGILITNQAVDHTAAVVINDLFFEVLIAKSYSKEALEILKKNKKRVLILLKDTTLPKKQFKSLLGGTLVQESDLMIIRESDLQTKTVQKPTQDQITDLLFADKICKHTQSNAIILAKHGQLIGSGMGQPSRIDAVRQAIDKARKFGFNLKDAVMASDAFFPFPDGVEMAHDAGISAIIQPGGSIKDQQSIDFCNQNNVSMVFTNIRHFKHN